MSNPLLDALNQEIDWDFLESFGYQGEKNFEKDVTYTTHPPISGLKMRNFKEINHDRPKEVKTSILFWAADTSPMVLSHLKRACDKVGYKPRFGEERCFYDAFGVKLDDDSKAYSLLDWVLLKTPRVGVDYLIKTAARKEKFEKVSSWRDFYTKVKTLDILFEWGIPPFQCHLNIARFATPIWKAFAKAFAKAGKTRWDKGYMTHAFHITYSSAEKIERASFLLERGASINELGSFQENIWRQTFREGLPFEQKWVNFLLKKGVDPHNVDACQKNAWFDVVEFYERLQVKGHAGIRHKLFSLGRRLVLLQKCKVNIDHQDALGDTPMHHCVKQELNAVTILTLVKLGASLSIKNKQGETPLDVAINEGKADLASLLFKLEADHAKEKLEQTVPAVTPKSKSSLRL